VTIEPYYQDDFATIYHGDNRQIAPGLGRFDLLLTDPPYGIGLTVKKMKTRGRDPKRGGVALAGNYDPFDWDKSAPSIDELNRLRETAGHQIIWGGNYFALPPSSCWLVWDKVNGANDFADCELAWTNLKKAVRKITWQWNGMIQEIQNKKLAEKKVHPTQKPLAVINFCLNQVPDAKTVFDPFMGSGTTLLAAKQKGLKAVGIELSEQYCEAAANRLSQGVLWTPTK